MLAAIAFGERPAEGGNAGPLGGVLDTLEFWNRSGGLWKLLAFGMQASLMLILGTALAEAPVIRRGIEGLTKLVASPRQLVALTAFVAVSLGLLNWSLSLIGGALLAREAGRMAKSRGWKLHYPLLCAAAYSGLMVWHGGLSGTAPLKVTSTKDLHEVLGKELTAKIGIIPLDRTIFSDLNLLISGGLLVLAPVLFYLLTPSEDPDPTSISEETERAGLAIGSLASEEPPKDVVERIERSSVINWALAFPLFAALVLYLAKEGVGRLDLNTVNLALWCFAMMLHGRPDRFVKACERGIKGCTGIMLQFPLYAGIMGVMAGSGLSAKMTGIVADAGAGALSLLTFASAGLVNLFVPSGGGQWAVQGPIIVEAALRTGVPIEKVLMAMAYGDQWTNMLQPFWALPLLAITGVRARDIVGYTVIWMAAGGIWITLGLVFF
jgi:short-chain fatty acids transporter